MIGITIGALAVVVILGVAAYFFIKRRKERSRMAAQWNNRNSLPQHHATSHQAFKDCFTAGWRPSGSNSRRSLRHAESPFEFGELFFLEKSWDTVLFRFLPCQQGTLLNRLGIEWWAGLFVRVFLMFSFQSTYAFRMPHIQSSGHQSEWLNALRSP